MSFEVLAFAHDEIDVHRNGQMLRFSHNKPQQWQEATKKAGRKVRAPCDETICVSTIAIQRMPES